MNDWQFIGRLFSNSYYVPVKGVRKTAQESNKWEKIICEFFDENNIDIIAVECGSTLMFYLDIRFKQEEDENFFLILTADGLEI